MYAFLIVMTFVLLLFLLHRGNEGYRGLVSLQQHITSAGFAGTIQLFVRSFEQLFFAQSVKCVGWN